METGLKERQHCWLKELPVPIQKTSLADTREITNTEYIALKEEIRKLRKRESERKRRASRPKQAPFWAAPILELPDWMQDTATEVATDPSMRDTMRHVLDRAPEFRSHVAAVLVGIGIDPKARAHFDRMLDRHWAETPVGVVGGYQELIVGGGLHAAVYAATRVRMGKPRPLIIEKERVGGAFSWSRGPGFHLNSRNRPGLGSRPGDSSGSLNYLPGCLIQPADMGGEEYQTNDALAWVVRANIALYADVTFNEVTFTSGLTLTGRNRKTIARASQRVIIATGFGPPRKQFPQVESDRHLTFQQFMGMMDTPFPMRDMRRVAVLGDGDSGKCAIEALTGQGPKMLTSHTLDYPEIDWYGVDATQRTRENWEACNRSRYKGIGSMLKTARYTTDSSRINLRGRDENRFRASTMERGLDCVYVDGRPYDLVIDCTGYTRPVRPLGNLGPFGSYGTDTGGSSIAGRDSYIWTVGPCAKIEPSETDRERFRQVGENGTSIFYLARKTEALALELP
jgi:hypothetical protein